MSALHTPGPWKVLRPTIHSPTRIISADGHYVMDAPNGSVHSQVRRDADARLIAAAPDLLNLLERLARDIEAGVTPGTPESNVVRSEIRAAIAKATGGAS